MSIGGIEAGGTRWICAVSHDGASLDRVESFATTGRATELDRDSPR